MMPRKQRTSAASSKAEPHANMDPSREWELSNQHSREVLAGGRFEFGRNWRRFLRLIDEHRVRAAAESLQSMLETVRLDGKTFLDIGSGSGLFSLAACTLGARVHSFDYDPESVWCTRYLKEKFAPDAEWTIEQGSVLDPGYLGTLGHFNVVYSWGVLHHTGRMWSALENVVPLVGPGGKLFIAIYNDQGSVSKRWRALKRLYNRSPRVLKSLVSLPVFVYQESRAVLGDLLRGKNPLTRWRRKSCSRGMSRWRDWIDWVGGYPFEVAKPEAIFEFYRTRGFTLTKLRTQGGSLGCNEYVFEKAG